MPFDVAALLPYSHVHGLGNVALQTYLAPATSSVRPSFLIAASARFRGSGPTVGPLLHLCEFLGLPIHLPSHPIRCQPPETPNYLKAKAT